MKRIFRKKTNRTTELKGLFEPVVEEKYFMMIGVDRKARVLDEKSQRIFLVKIVLDNVSKIGYTINIRVKRRTECIVKKNFSSGTKDIKSSKSPISNR